MVRFWGCSDKNAAVERIGGDGWVVDDYSSYLLIGFDTYEGSFGFFFKSRPKSLPAKC